MPVILDSKDLAKLDEQFAAESAVWTVLNQGAKNIAEADFVGANEVRVNKMTGFTTADYVRNGDNARAKVDVTKETRKLEFERWMAYDLDVLDQSENGVYDPYTVLEQHIRLQAIPEKDRNAVSRLLTNSDKLVTETPTAANALDSYDAAEQYMIDTEVTGNMVMFVSTAFNKLLKQSAQVQRTYQTNITSNVAGIDRRVDMLDSGVPIIKVPQNRLQVDTTKIINFILMPLHIAAPIEKYNDVTLIPSSSDRDGYRDTIKGLNYYDLIVFDNAKPGIYVSYQAVTP